MVDRHVPGIRTAEDRVRERGQRVSVDGYTEHIDSVRLDWIWSGELAQQGYTDDDLVTTARVLSRTCPTCHAGLGAWCRTAAGHVLAHLDQQHVSRRVTGATN